MDQFKHNLKVLGLSEEEIILYLTALEQGSTTVLALARKTDIPRTTVYLLIDSLIEKGLIHVSDDDKKKEYHPVSPNELLKIAEKQKTQMQETMVSLRHELPQLEALYALHHEKPRIRYYEGMGEVKKIYEDSLKYENIYFHHMSPAGKTIMEAYGETYWAEVLKRMIFTKQIISDTEKNKRYIQKEATDRNQMICIPRKYETNTDYLIYGDTVVFFTYKNNQPLGIVLDDTEIAHFERMRFMMLWEQFS